MPDLARVSSVAGEVAVIDDGGGTRVKSAAAEVAVIDDGGGTRVKSVAAEVAILSGEGGTRVKSAAAEIVLIDNRVPNIVLPDTSGQPNQSVTFDASASLVETYKWSWTSVPGGSSVSNLSDSYPDGTRVSGTEMPDGTAVTPIAMPNNQAATPVDMTDNVLLMHMDGNADDDSGQGNNGTIVSATLVSGKVGSGAYQFNGTSDVITIPNTADLSMGVGVSWSVCAWVKPTMATTGWEGFLYHGAAGSNQILFARSSSGYFAAGNGGSGNWQVSISDQFLYSNVWYHLAAVVDRSANTITLYVNGRQVKTQAWTFVPSATTDDSTVGRGYGAAETFGGVIDELAVWRRALSASEIQGIYDLQKGWENLSTPADMEANEALYHLDGTVDDDSGAGRNLTLYNTPTFPTGQVGSNCIQFDGVNQYAQATVPVSLNGTIACWLQLTGTPTAGDVFIGLGVNTSSTNGTWRSISYHTSGLSFYGRGNAANDIYNWGGSLTVGQWYHVVITWDDTDLVSCYLDGVLITAQTKTLLAPASELSLGARLNAGPYYAPCKLDEVAVWSRAISAAEVASLYALQEASVTNPTTPIDMTDNAVLYHCDEASGTVGTDDSGNINDATLSTINTGTVAGKVGTYAWEYTGSSSVALATIPLASDWTIAFWFYNLAPNSAWRTGARGTDYHHIIVENGGDRLGVYVSGAFRPVNTGFTMPSASYTGWHHIAAVGTGGNTIFYVDGVKVGTVTGYQPTDQLEAIGNYQLLTQRFADRLDEIAVWQRALSASEIEDIYIKQNGEEAGPRTSTFTFTPDVAGTYTIELSSTAQGGFSGSATADAVIAAASGAGSNSRYGLLSGLRLNRDAVFSGNVVKRIVKRKK